MSVLHQAISWINAGLSWELLGPKLYINAIYIMYEIITDKLVYILQIISILSGAQWVYI